MKKEEFMTLRPDLFTGRPELLQKIETAVDKMVLLGPKTVRSIAEQSLVTPNTIFRIAPNDLKHGFNAVEMAFEWLGAVEQSESELHDRERADARVNATDQLNAANTAASAAKEQANAAKDSNQTAKLSLVVAIIIAVATGVNIHLQSKSTDAAVAASKATVAATDLALLRHELEQSNLKVTEIKTELSEKSAQLASLVNKTQEAVALLQQKSKADREAFENRLDELGKLGFENQTEQLIERVEPPAAIEAPKELLETLKEDTNTNSQ